MDILYDLLDETLIDRKGHRCGRVDDVVVEDVFNRPARVTALLSGGGTKAGLLWKPLERISCWVLARLGMPQPVRPTVVPWAWVERIDDDVYLNVVAEEVGLDEINRAVAERVLKHIPGANS